MERARRGGAAGSGPATRGRSSPSRPRAADGRPVERVVPLREGAKTVLEITPREKVAFQPRVEGETVALEFARPVAPRAAP